MTIDLYRARDRHSQEDVLIKVYKDFKAKPDEFQAVILKQIKRTLELQRLPGASTRLNLIRKYLMINNNLYVVAQLCNETLQRRL